MNHTGVLAVGTYLGFSLAVGIFTFVVNSLYGFNYVKINLKGFSIEFSHKLFFFVIIYYSPIKSLMVLWTLKEIYKGLVMNIRK